MIYIKQYTYYTYYLINVDCSNNTNYNLIIQEENDILYVKNNFFYKIFHIYL